MKTTAVLLTIACLAVSAYAHAYFSCPKPRTQDNNALKQYPCGSGDENNNFDGPYTVVEPGPLTVVMTETINHNGAPMRFALSMGDDNGFESNVLLDHLPHWDNSPVATPRQYYVTIDIPDVDCTKTNCVLQNVQVMTGKLSGNDCDQLDGPSPSCISVYHSCANIRITGSTPIDEYTHTYVAPPGFLDPQPNVWSKGESGAFTQLGDDGGWSDLQSTTVEQPDICNKCVNNDVSECDAHVASIQEGVKDDETSGVSSIIPAAVAVVVAICSFVWF